MKIYVAGSSRELDRAEKMIASAVARGHTITFDWTIDMRAGPSDADLDAHEARRYANMDLDAIEIADGLIFLSPTTQTKGAWVELGYAYGRGKPVVVSRPGPRVSIFEEIGILCTDETALITLEEKVG